VTTEAGILLNEKIVYPTIRLINEVGEQVGIVTRQEALQQARTCNMDLVLIANSDPPVCKILDAGKWRYERQKVERAAAKKQRKFAVEVKEIQLRPVTSANDLAIKSRKAREFLAEGDKVKIVVKFRGREMSHKERGHAILAAFVKELGEHKVERTVDGGNNLTLIVAPTRTKAEIVALA
jgi:translation initiation factor IF-3